MSRSRLNWLRSIVWLIATVTDPRRKNEAVRLSRHQPTEHDEAQALQDIVAKLNPIAAAADEYRAHNQQQNSRYRWTLGLEVATLIAVAAYAIASFMTLGAIRDQLNTLRTDQRAWASVSNVKLVRTPGDATKLSALITVTNTGKTPAFSAAVKGSALVFGHIGQPDTDPGEVPDGIPYGRPQMIPPNGGLLTWTTPPYQIPNDWNGSVFATVKVRYEDVARCVHWLEVCRAHSTGADPDHFGACDRSDAMDIGVDCDKKK